MYVCMQRFGDTSTRAYTRTQLGVTQARGATSELRRVADTTAVVLASRAVSCALGMEFVIGIALVII